MFDKIERCRVKPLQVIEEQGQRMFRSRERGDEPPEHQLETPSRVVGGQFRDWWLVADDQLELWDEVDHERPIRAQRLHQRIPPATQLGVALAEQVADQALKRLGERGIRDDTLVLIELPR